MSKYCREHIETTTLRPPSHDQAAYYSLYSYFQRTIDKVKVIHQQIATKFPSSEKGRNYARVTNEEIIQRGCFLHYIYNCLLSLYELSLEWKITVSEASKSEGAFKLFLNDLIFSSSDLTKISRFKRNHFGQDQFCLKINQALLSILFQTEIYTYQILLRIFKINLIHKEHTKIQDQIEKLQKRFSFSSQVLKVRKSPSKKEKMACKTLLKEIQEIYTYYHCDISINREECNTKPEMQCLIQLLKEKESESFLALLKSGCKLFNLPDVAIVYEIPTQIQQEPDIEVKQLQSTTQKPVNEQIPVVDTIPENQEPKHSQEQAISEPQQAEQSSDNQIVIATELNQVEKQQQQEVAHQEREKPAVNQQKITYHPQQKKPKKAHTPKHSFDLSKWTFYQNQQKINPNPKQKSSKSTSKNKTTFNHSSASRFFNCSFRIYKSKQPSDRSKVKEKRRDDIKRYRVEDPLTPFVNYKRQRSDVAEDCLAQQTPIRNRVFVPSTPSKN